jgi:pilus assembly protein TadC
MASLGSRIAATILVIVFWFAFIVLYLAFFAWGLDWWQKAAVFLASGAIAIGLIAVFWVKWIIH